jgi:plasmid stabilization system protein ParE
MIVRFTRRAESDLAAVVDYLLAMSPRGAQSVAASLRESINVIAEHPQGGRRTTRPAIFVKIVPRYPYKVFYRVRGDVVEIVHIRHAARRPWTASR